MGQILRSKVLPSGKVILNIELTPKEAMNLKNHAKKIHLFSENLCTHDAKIISKGVNKETKSVEIPLGLKSRNNPKITEISYQKIEAGKKIFYVAIAKKDMLNN